MLTISLEEMKFYAGHGVYPEENALQNTLLVDVSVTIETPEKTDILAQSVDYEKLHEIIQKEMDTPVALLERVAESGVRRIKEEFPHAKVIEIKISKLNPPMGGETKRSKITLLKNYD